MRIVYGIDGNYFFPALVSIFSAIANASKPIDVVIFAEGLGKRELDIIRRFNDNVNSTIQVCEFNCDRFGKNLQTFNMRFPAVSLLPLILPQLFDNRCLFLDADTLVIGDIWELLSVDLGDFLLGACADTEQVWQGEKMISVRVSDIFHPTRNREQKRDYIERAVRLRFLPDEDKYFNSGVIVMDCERIRKERLDYMELTDLEKIQQHSLSLPDQDRMNEFFYGSWLRLPIKWNTPPGIWKAMSRICRLKRISEDFRSELCEASVAPQLWHYIGSNKPWIRRGRYLRRTRPAYRDYSSMVYKFEQQTGLTFDLGISSKRS